MRSRGARFDYGTCMFTARLDSGFFGVQPDRHGGEESGGPPAEMLYPFGFGGRPRDPETDPDGALKVGANALLMESGPEEFVMPMGDPRYAKLLPDPGKGGSYQFATTKVGEHLDLTLIVLNGDDGSIKARVPYSNGSKANEIEVTVDHVKVTNGEGPSLTVGQTHVDVGGEGGSAIMYDSGAMQTYFKAIETALTALGKPVTAPLPSVYRATKGRVV